jgi:Ni/Co efflux regulator RcnB
MKYAVAIFAAALVGVTPAIAQQHQHPQPTSHVSHPAMQSQSAHSTHPATHPSATQHRTVHHTAQHPRTTTRHAVSHHRTHATAHTRHVARNAARHVAHHVAAHAAFHRAPAVVVAKFRKNVVAVHRFHAGPYRSPLGWRYRRWVFGERLPSIYFGRSYWITDFLAFALVAPPDGYVWVRYGPDAVLIDQYTGEIIQVNYGVFY